MRILVAGAAGALGRHLVPRLIVAGHQVVGTTRHPAKTDAIRRLGGEPAVVDGLDGARVREVVLSIRPEVIVHEMTDLSSTADLRHFDRVFATSNRLRSAGLDHLLAAAREASVKRIIAQSFCSWPYAREGATVKSEEDALDPHPPRAFRRTLDAIRYLEDRVTQGSDLKGVVLRYGGFYGVDTGLFDPLFIDQIGKRHVPVIGSGDGWWSFILSSQPSTSMLVRMLMRSEPERHLRWRLLSDVRSGHSSNCSRGWSMRNRAVQARRSSGSVLPSS